MDDGLPRREPGLLSADDVAQYRRDGYVVLRGAIGMGLVEACRDALSGLASGRIAVRDTLIMMETGYKLEDIAPEKREFYVRKYMDFVEDAPALKAAAMGRRLHAAIDQIMGTGRVLFQEMALVKPPRIGADKPWHQDCSYFRITDPGLVVGVWIALDPALRQNGCMEMIPGSHLRGPAPHVHENDFNRCRIVDSFVHAERAVPVEMQPGDALIFHSLIHHFTAANNSDLTRRAIQFHYHQSGAVWGTLAEHQRLFHDAGGRYAGCTVPHADRPSNYVYRAGLPRPVVPMDESA